MTNIQKFTIAKCFDSAFFFLAIGAFFFTDRGFTAEQIFLLFSIFSFSLVIFEYPTGIIADRFTYKGVLTLGTIVMGFAFMINALPLTFEAFAVLFCLSAFFSALTTGSDNALLHHISDDFKKDFAHVKFVSLLVRSFVVAIGGFIYVYAPNMPYILTGIAYIIAGLIFWSIDDRKHHEKKSQETSFSIMKQGMQYVLRQKQLLAVILFAGSISAIMISTKWVVPTFFDRIGLSPEVFSTAFACGTILIAIGSKLSVSRRFQMKFRYSAFALIVCIALLGFPYSWVVIPAMVLAFFFQGFVDVEVVDIINRNALDKARASILSLKSLSSRLIGGVHVLLVGALLHVITPLTLMLGVGVFLGLMAFGVVMGVRWDHKRA